MKQNPFQNPVTILLVMTLIFVASTPVNAWKYHSEYNQVVSERDDARRERDEARRNCSQAIKERDTAIQQRIDDLKQGNPAQEKQLEDLRTAVAKRLEDSRQATAKELADSQQEVAAALSMTAAGQQRSGKWQSIALAGTASCFLIGMVVGLGIGVKARRDHHLQQAEHLAASTVVRSKE